MGEGQGAAGPRPQTSLTPPPVASDDASLLTHLLTVELERLEVAREIERERSTVFPETSVIIRDILKLHAALARLGLEKDEGEGGDSGDVLLERLVTELAEE